MPAIRSSVRVLRGSRPQGARHLLSSSSAVQRHSMQAARHAQRACHADAMQLCNECNRSPVESGTHRRSWAGSVLACPPAQPASELFPSSVCLSMGRGPHPPAGAAAGPARCRAVKRPGSACAPVGATSRLIRRAGWPETTGRRHDRWMSAAAAIDGCGADGTASTGLDGTKCRWGSSLVGGFKIARASMARQQQADGHW